MKPIQQQNTVTKPIARMFLWAMFLFIFYGAFKSADFLEGSWGGLALHKLFKVLLGLVFIIGVFSFYFRNKFIVQNKEPKKL